MGEIRFMISEAAKQVHVESHVLRYWEEELNLTIGRTEMGHRYYTEDDIQLFRCIRKLKNEGMLLKDLKPLIPKLKETRSKLAVSQSENSQYIEKAACTEESHDEDRVSSMGTAIAENVLAEFSVTDTKHTEDTKLSKPALSTSEKTETTVLTPTEAEVIPVTQLEQVRGLIGDVLAEVVTDNNKVLETSICKKITTDVIREMDFLFQAKERQEEEHYRKLDCLIRQQQAARKELAEKETAFGKLKKMLT